MLTRELTQLWAQPRDFRNKASILQKVQDSQLVVGFNTESQSFKAS